MPTQKRPPQPATLPTLGPTTRLAPSPTGALHLGNALAFLANWAMARNSGWHTHLRIEDLDTPRVKPGVIDQTIDTLAWLGMDWDSGPEIQSADLAPYTDAMKTLANKGLIYPCTLSRTQIEASASAPNEGTHETRFDPALRPKSIPKAFADPSTNWRLIVEPGAVEFNDACAGLQSVDVDASVGDFVVWTKRRCPSYQLAVVVDDAALGVTEIVRGNDLIDSTARQILLLRALGIESIPRYTHLPLVRGPDGRRLAKRHGDTRIDHYRAQGTAADRIIGLIAYWCNITPTRTPMSATQFRERFSLDTLPRTDIVCTPEDDQWLKDS